jgi:hypothetical protein
MKKILAGLAIVALALVALVAAPAPKAEACGPVGFGSG